LWVEIKLHLFLASADGAGRKWRCLVASGVHTTRNSRGSVLGARVLRDWSTHIVVSATRLVVMVLILSSVGVARVHVFVRWVDIASGWGWWTIVVVWCVVGRVVGWVWCVRKIAVYMAHRCGWWGREIVGLWEVAGVIGVCSRLARAVLARTVATVGTVAALTIGRLIIICSSVSMPIQVL
jgi:hypothetical protein